MNSIKAFIEITLATFTARFTVSFTVSHTPIENQTNQANS
jgi:hypothetical protein